MAESWTYRYSLSCKAKTIDSLAELQPGDHISARGQLGDFMDELTPNLKVYTHHMLVVKVISDSEIKIIHKTRDGVVEEKRTYKPEDITVLDYDCNYSGRDAVRRAQDRKGEKDYKLVWSNCEHFVTEVRTGTAQSIQVQTAMFGAAVGIALGVAVGAYMLSKKGRKRRESDSDEEQNYRPNRAAQ